VKIIPLASSSKGNAYAVVKDGEVVLIDCGLTCKKLCARCAEKGIDAASITAVLITHDHSDHVDGLRVFLNKFDVPVYANIMTAEKITHKYGVAAESFVCFENGQEFDIGAFGVTPFSTPHDAVDSVGYLIRTEGLTYFHGTDIGTPLDSIGRNLAQADVATLESNHDPGLVLSSDRDESLKRRILGPRGHLSNSQAADLVRKFATAKLKKLYLAHLSEECNAPHIAEREMRSALDERKLGVELIIL
jgi:phosphoribosyl 1,2-cyclic phosphodiesterase